MSTETAYPATIYITRLRGWRYRGRHRAGARPRPAHIATALVLGTIVLLGGTVGAMSTVWAW